MSVTLPAEVKLLDATKSFLAASPKRLFINGEFVDALDGATFATYNPATGQELVQVALAGPEDVDRAVRAARTAFEDGPWNRMSVEERSRILWKLADLIDQYAGELAELETLDNGKPLRISRRGDLPAASRHFRYYAGWADKLEGDSIPVHYPDHFVYTLREPVGVVGLIIPWNFPLLMCAWKLAPALACGNTAILKPAEETPLTALRLAELIQEAGFPEGVVNVLTGPGVPTGSSIASHVGVDKVAFTGSTEVGRKIMEASAQSNLKRISLELGGKSPLVIFADADLEKAVKSATWAMFSTAGQECVAATRLFIEKPVYDEALAGLTEQARRIRVDHGFAEKVHVGPVVSQTQLDRIMGYLEIGRGEGVEIITGGERLGGHLANGYFIQPTLYNYQDDDLKIVQEEIFGPVVGLTTFDSPEELASRVNRTTYGLAAGIWTKDVSKAHRFAQAIKAGTVWINSYGLFSPAAPFGGYKQSGFGREMGKEALELYTQVKTVWVGLS